MAQIMTSLGNVRDGYGANLDVEFLVEKQGVDEETKEYWIEFYNRLNAAWEEHADKILELYGAIVVGDEIHCPHYTSPDYDDYKPFPEIDSEEFEEIWEQIYDEWDRDAVEIGIRISKEILGD
ncbi:hypothetical protein ACU19_09360 [Actinobaculum suis]|uniref:hypothetical protein n=1 Tax=Actinobaculum suis TaxID=1657 RepID=UPI00066FE1F4|nr:hypothetical protein [Actinobaculum suis]KMY22563.1 hypothetical protein ACU19_09360 [Actinobaculum suis]